MLTKGIMFPCLRHILDNAHTLSATEVAGRLGVDRQRLSTAEANRRVVAVGRNELARCTVPAWRRFAAQFESPLVLLLLLATVVSFVVWLIESKGQCLTKLSRFSRSSSNAFSGLCRKRAPKPRLPACAQWLPLRPQ
jgi:magnesium-transporting ATPase (P-type)